MELGGKIYKENIVLNLEASTKKEVIGKLAGLLLKNGFVNNLEEFTADVNKREEQMTTGIGNEIAIPHGKSNAVLESTVVFAKLNRKIEWNSLDNEPVNIVFLLAIATKDKGDNHLRLLANIAGKLMDDDFVKSIKESTTKEEIESLLLGIKIN